MTINEWIINALLNSERTPSSAIYRIKGFIYIYIYIAFNKALRQRASGASGGGWDGEKQVYTWLFGGGGCRTVRYFDSAITFRGNTKKTIRHQRWRRCLPSTTTTTTTSLIGLYLSNTRWGKFDIGIPTIYRREGGGKRVYAVISDAAVVFFLFILFFFFRFRFTLRLSFASY